MAVAEKDVSLLWKVWGQRLSEKYLIVSIDLAFIFFLSLAYLLWHKAS